MPLSLVWEHEGKACKNKKKKNNSLLTCFCFPFYVSVQSVRGKSSETTRDLKILFSRNQMNSDFHSKVFFAFPHIFITSVLCVVSMEMDPHLAEPTWAVAFVCTMCLPPNSPDVLDVVMIREARSTLRCLMIVITCFKSFLWWGFVFSSLPGLLSMVTMVKQC